ncbi:MAG: histidinol-phosphatase HisJ family protein [Christensenellales bacterium]
MRKVDSHTHSEFSADGSVKISEMVNRAIADGGRYLCITDHFDLDALKEYNNAPDGWTQLNLPAYEKNLYEARKESEKHSEEFYLGFGIEAGYDENAKDDYKKIIDEKPFDAVINSVHFVEGYDVYFPDFFLGREKDDAYRSYLKKVYKSLDVSYHYDIVGHIGYCVRNAKYEDKIMHFDEFSDLLEAILKKIIALDKTLEVNTHHALCPNEEILKKYFEFGGRKISFGSDAHRGDVYKDFDKTVEMLKGIGFSGFTYFKRHKECFEKFD